MSMIRIVSAIILAFACTSVGAHKGMHGPGAEFDADENGVLSLQEYTAYLKASKQDVAAATAMFTKIDLDKSGSLTSAEFIVGLPKAGTQTSTR